MLFAIPLLWSSAAGAQNTYLLSGKLISSRGHFIKIPILGNTVANCGGLERGYRDNPGQGMVTDTPVPPTGKITTQSPVGQFGCVSVAAGINTTKNLLAKGQTFTVPAGAISRPLPGYTVAVSVPKQPAIVQLATSFAIMGPPSMVPLFKTATMTYMTCGGTCSDDQVGLVKMDLMAPFFTRTLGPKYATSTVGGGNNLATPRKLQKNAWQQQTGRGGADFSWCFGYSRSTTSPWSNYQCQAIGGGTQPVIVKNFSKANAFGGTMNYIITTGPNPSSLAAGPGLTAPGTGGPIALLGLAGMGHQPTGRGYRDLLTDRIMTGPVWLAHMENWVAPAQFQTDPSNPKSFLLITNVNGLNPTMTGIGTATAATNVNVGFPWTTGTVLVRQSGKTAGQSMTATFTGRGTDTTTGTGATLARNITLVAPGLAVTNIGDGTRTAQIGFLQLSLPEPAGGSQLLAGALVLAGIAAWRGRRSRGA